MMEGLLAKVDANQASPERMNASQEPMIYCIK
jgi:hypothetical protein